jgi:hypothetical protein
MKGKFDASLDGGLLYGLGLSDFYASAPTLKRDESDRIIYNALNFGITPIKKMHIIGSYDNGNIKTTEPFTLLMPHVDASGMFEIENNEMTAQLKMLMRGTSASPKPIDLIVSPNNIREFSLSEIMLHFDPEYMREFVKSHNKF